MVEISVILPVYNSEEYLKECLDSLCNQTFDDFEILCINDGSSDNSLEILREYEKTDKRITVISQENQGVAKTRNDALTMVNGSYVYFMDADDVLDKNAFKKLHANLVSNGSDFCIMKVIFDNGIEKYKFPAFDLDKEFSNVNFEKFTFTYKDVKNHVLNDLFAPWLKMYNRDFLIKGDFTFPDIKSYSDAPFHVKTMLEAKKISFIPEYLYCYKENDDSLVHSSSNTINFFTLSDIIEDYLAENNYFNEFREEFISFQVSKLVYYMGFTDSDEYYSKAKSILQKICNDNSLKDFDLLDKKDLDKTDLILDSDNLKEAKLALELYDCKRRVKSMQESKSWKVTGPLRKFTSSLK